jgi:hypothetical protein
MAPNSNQINSYAPAILKKWPSIGNQRVNADPSSEPYTVIDGTLDECIQKFLQIPISQHHLSEIRTALQGELVWDIMRGEQIRLIARLRDFL